MAQTINLSTLTSSQGFSINSASTGDYLGYSVRYAGDLNNDGIADFILGAPGTTDGDGSSYVIFGSIKGFSNINLATLTSSQGFSIYSTTYEQNGYSVSAAGDVNGDGYDDIIIGAPGFSSYVIFGQASFNFPNNGLNVDTMSSTQGFSIYLGGSYPYNPNFGSTVSGAGDFNNDGYADLIIGEPGSGNGISYLIFGHSGSFSDINVADGLTASQGFSILGSSTAQASGAAVSGAGDVNKDGYADIIIYALGSSYASPSQVCVGYIIFGGTNTATINLASLSPQQGFSITTTAACNWNSFSEGSVSAAGDVNGDGYADVILGNPCTTTESYSVETGYISYDWAGVSYVIFGNQTNYLSNINLADTPNGWIYIASYTSSAETGISVSGAGDFNGDGYDDVIIGAPNLNGHAGVSYLVFGGPSLTSISLNSFNGFYINGASCGTSCQSGFSVSTAGDINNDGLQDVLIGAPYNYVSSQQSSASFVVYGFVPPTTAPTAMPTLKPTAAPSFVPTALPTFVPSIIPSPAPTVQPTLQPTAPTSVPTEAPTHPTYAPTQKPTQPTPFPTVMPTNHPINPTVQPSKSSEPTSTTATTDSNNQANSPSAGETAGIVIGIIGGVLGLILTCVKIYYYWKKANENNDKKLPLSRYFSASEYNLEKTIDIEKVRKDFPYKNFIHNDLTVNILLSHTHAKETDLVPLYTNILQEKSIISSLLKQTATILSTKDTNTILIFDENANSGYFKAESVIVIGKQDQTKYINPGVILAHELVHFVIANADEKFFDHQPLNDICKIALAKLLDHIKLLENQLDTTKDFSFASQEFYLIERFKDFNNTVYSEEVIKNEELVARCIEFRAANISNEILEICKPIEDFIMLGVGAETM